jgi:hypothetical protein
MDAPEVIPFKYHGSALRPDANNSNRLKIYREFMGVGTLAHVHSLDVSEPGYISEELRVGDNTLRCDFNYEVLAPSSRYEIVTCFEVLNHVMNPLQMMEQIWDLMALGGVCYLSAPKLWLIPWHHCKYNFVNYAPERLVPLFQYAGFEVIRHKTYNPWPWWFMFYGFRPIARVLFNRIELWELRKV